MYNVLSNGIVFLWVEGSSDVQFVPFDVVEEALVGADFLGLDRLEQVPAIVCQSTHQVVLLIAAKERKEGTNYSGVKIHHSIERKKKMVLSWLCLFSQFTFLMQDIFDIMKDLTIHKLQ